jgi:hypothetical protein
MGLDEQVLRLAKNNSAASDVLAVTSALFFKGDNGMGERMQSAAAVFFNGAMPGDGYVSARACVLGAVDIRLKEQVRHRSFLGS